MSDALLLTDHTTTTTTTTTATATTTIKLPFHKRSLPLSSKIHVQFEMPLAAGVPILTDSPALFSP